MTVYYILLFYFLFQTHFPDSSSKSGIIDFGLQNYHRSGVPGNGSLSVTGSGGLFIIIFIWPLCLVKFYFSGNPFPTICLHAKRTAAKYDIYIMQTDRLDITLKMLYLNAENRENTPIKMRIPNSRSRRPAAIFGAIFFFSANSQ